MSIASASVFGDINDKEYQDKNRPPGDDSNSVSSFTLEDHISVQMCYELNGVEVCLRCRPAESAL